MKKVKLLLVGAVFALSGCDYLGDLGARVAEKSGLQQPTPIIMPGAEVMAGIEKLVIYGDDECPVEGNFLVFGGSRPAGGRNCIAIPKERKIVTVHIVTHAGILTEQWSIHRDGDRGQQMSLWRPDGSPIGAVLN